MYTQQSPTHPSPRTLLRTSHTLTPDDIFFLATFIFLCEACEPSASAYPPCTLNLQQQCCMFLFFFLSEKQLGLWIVDFIQCLPSKRCRRTSHMYKHFFAWSVYAHWLACVRFHNSWKLYPIVHCRSSVLSYRCVSSCCSSAHRQRADRVGSLLLPPLAKVFRRDGDELC